LTFQSPWALLVLAILVPICLTHLRHPPRREVASTLLWRELDRPAAPRRQRIARPALPLLLLLQVLCVVLAAAALAEPAGSGSGSGPARAHIFVLDAAARGAARGAAASLIRRVRAGTRITVIAASARPQVLVAGTTRRDQALHAVAALAPGRSPANLAAAVGLAAWDSAIEPGPVAVTVIRARGDPLPPVTDPGHELTVVTIGRDDAAQAATQAATQPPARCQPMPHCVVSAHPLPRRANVTIVGSGGAMGDLTRAFEAVPGVATRALTPARYLAAHPAANPTAHLAGDLLVLDHWLPGGHIPPAASVLLVDPPTLARGPLTDAVLTGTDDRSPLLAGVDLTALSVPASATERIAAPPWLAPVAWAPGGPLLAAGANGGQRVAVLAFDPARSNLPQLDAFPILMQNVVRWIMPTAAQPDDQAIPVRFTQRRGTPTAPAPRPWWRWMILAALLAIAAEAGYMVLVYGTHGRGALGVRLGAAALLGVALTGPGLSRPGGGAPLLLADQSGSIAGPVRTAENSWLRAFTRAVPQAKVMPFGMPTDTDIGQALVLGEAALGTGSASRLVLVSDGLATSGDAVAVARTVKAPVDVTEPEPAAEAPDAAVTRLTAPRAVRASDTIPLQVTVHATVARPASVTVWRDGQAVSRLAVRLAVGDNPLLISSPSGAPGWRRFRVTVAMPGDRLPGNDTLDAVTNVAAPPHLLYVGDDGPFAGMLRQLGFVVEVRSPSALPVAESGFNGTDGIILNNMTNGVLVPAQVSALSTAVKTKGMGLLVLGGTHSLTAAWYAGTPLAAALPVAGTGSGPPGSAALELVLDRSGSMNDLAGDVTKISMAKAAALGAIEFARAHQDRLGIISFDTAPHLLVPMQVMTKANATAAERAVAGLTADGGTDIYGALRAAAGQITRLSGSAAAPVAAPAAARVAARQMILMTDGVSQSGSYDALLRGLRGSGAPVTLTTVGLGGEVDKALLQHLAAIGGGRYYYTNNAADLPRIFTAEERRTARPDDVTGRIPAVVSASVPAVRSLVGARVPDVAGMDATALKPRATADITSGTVTISGAGGAGVGGSGAGGSGAVAERYPLLAQWQYGLGRVAVWTPGVAQGWATGWAGRAGLWNDTVRWLLAGVPSPVLRAGLLDAHPSGAPAVVVDTLGNAGVMLPVSSLRATVLPPRGSAVEMTLNEAGPGRYTGTLPNGGPGVYRMTVSPPGAVGTLTELAVGYPREYLPSPLGSALLAQIAAATGGRVLADPVSAAAWERASNGTHQVSLWWLLTALELAAFAAAVWLRPPPPAHRSAAVRPANTTRVLV
jgi:Ca-activated chloride channel family protein